MLLLRHYSPPSVINSATFNNIEISADSDRFMMAAELAIKTDIITKWIPAKLSVARLYQQQSFALPCFDVFSPVDAVLYSPPAALATLLAADDAKAMDAYIIGQAAAANGRGLSASVSAHSEAGEVEIDVAAVAAAANAVVLCGLDNGDTHITDETSSHVTTTPLSDDSSVTVEVSVTGANRTVTAQSLLSLCIFHRAYNCAALLLRRGALPGASASATETVAAAAASGLAICDWPYFSPVLSDNGSSKSRLSGGADGTQGGPTVSITRTVELSDTVVVAPTLPRTGRFVPSTIVSHYSNSSADSELGDASAGHQERTARVGRLLVAQCKNFGVKAHAGSQSVWTPGTTEFASQAAHSLLNSPALGTLIPRESTVHPFTIAKAPLYLPLAPLNADPSAKTDTMSGFVFDLRCLRGWSPLHLASALGDLRGISLLLSAGAPLDCVDVTDQTPLVTAAIAAASGYHNHLLFPSNNNNDNNINNKAGSGNKFSRSNAAVDSLGKSATAELVTYLSRLGFNGAAVLASPLYNTTSTAAAATTTTAAAAAAAAAAATPLITAAGVPTHALALLLAGGAGSSSSASAATPAAAGAGPGSEAATAAAATAVSTASANVLSGVREWLVRAAARGQREAAVVDLTLARLQAAARQARAARAAAVKTLLATASDTGSGNGDGANNSSHNSGSNGADNGGEKVINLLRTLTQRLNTAPPHSNAGSSATPRANPGGALSVSANSSAAERGGQVSSGADPDPSTLGSRIDATSVSAQSVTTSAASDVFANIHALFNRAARNSTSSTSVSANTAPKTDTNASDDKITPNEASTTASSTAASIAPTESDTAPAGVTSAAIASATASSSRVSDKEVLAAIVKCEAALSQINAVRYQNKQISHEKPHLLC